MNNVVTLEVERAWRTPLRHDIIQRKNEYFKASPEKRLVLRGNLNMQLQLHPTAVVLHLLKRVFDEVDNG